MSRDVNMVAKVTDEKEAALFYGAPIIPEWESYSRKTLTLSQGEDTVVPLVGGDFFLIKTEYPVVVQLGAAVFLVTDFFYEYTTVGTSVTLTPVSDRPAGKVTVFTFKKAV